MRFAFVILLAVLIRAGGSVAATPCAHPGSSAAVPVFYYTADDAVLDGLQVTLDLGLEPPTFPSEDIAKHPDACVRAPFTAAAQTWTLFGDEDDTPPRWAISPTDPKRIVFIAAMPPAEQAHLWAESQRKHPTHEAVAKFKGFMYALVAADGPNRQVYGFYSALPDDARLSEAMTAVIERRWPAIVSFDVDKGQADLDRMIEPFTLMAIATKGKAEAIDIPAADGTTFRANPDGTLIAASSGLVCPSEGGSLRRLSMFVRGQATGSQEVGCRYAGERARLEIVATSAEGSVAPEEALKPMVALMVANSSGQPGTSPPLPTEIEPGVAAAFFTAPDGAQKGVWAFSRGKWAFEVYALYGAGDEAAVGAAVAAVIAPNKLP